jgi:hypothetical protein
MSKEILSRSVPAALSAWLSFLALDFFVHAAVLASWWQSTESYWRPPGMLLSMIPFAYVSFAMYCALLVWLQVRLLGPRPAISPSLRLAGMIGTVLGCSSVLATYSVIRMPLSALAVWPASFLVESLAAATASCFIFRSVRPWVSVLKILALVVLLLVIGIALQNMHFFR